MILSITPTLSIHEELAVNENTERDIVLGVRFLDGFVFNLCLLSALTKNVVGTPSFGSCAGGETFTLASYFDDRRDASLAKCLAHDRSILFHCFRVRSAKMMFLFKGVN